MADEERNTAEEQVAETREEQAVEKNDGKTVPDTVKEASSTDEKTGETVSKPVESEAEKEEKKGILKRLLEALRALYDSLHKNSAFSIFQEEIMKDMTALQFQNEINTELLSDLTDKLSKIEGLANLNSQNLEENKKQIEDFIQEDTELAQFVDRETGKQQFVLFNRNSLNEDLLKAGMGEEVSLAKDMIFIEQDMETGVTKIIPPTRFDDVINPSIDNRQNLTNMNFTLEDMDDIENHRVVQFGSRDLTFKQNFFTDLLEKTHIEIKENCEKAKEVLEEGIKAVKEGKDLNLEEVSKDIDSLIDKTAEEINKEEQKMRENQKALERSLAEKNEQANQQNIRKEIEESQKKIAELEAQLQREQAEKVKAEMNEKAKDYSGAVIGMYAGLKAVDAIKSLEDRRADPNAHMIHGVSSRFDKDIEDIAKILFTQASFKDGKLLSGFNFKLIDAESGHKFPLDFKAGESREIIERRLGKNYSEGYIALYEKTVKELTEEKVFRDTVKEEQENTTRPYNDFGVSEEKGDKVYVDDERGNIHQFTNKETATDFKEEKKEENYIEDKEEQEGRQ